MMRNQQLVTLAEDSIGIPTSAAYAEILRLAEPQLRKCKDELNIEDDATEVDLRTLPQVSTEDLTEIQHSLQNPPDLSGALGFVDPSKIDLRNILKQPKRPKKRRKPVDPEVDEASVEGSASSDESEKNSSENESDIAGIDHDSDSSGANGDSFPKKRKYKTPDTTPDTTPKTNGASSPSETLRQHLLLLAEQPQKFLIPVPRTKADTNEEWAIPYPTLSKTLLHNAILSITTSRFGPLAGRLIRILADSNKETKLDEKMLVLLALIPQKQMRTLLHSMHRAGHIELQEIPKDSSQRRPGMTMFFWFFDPERARKRMLDETYKTMTRLVQRAGVEREGVRSTVEKAERTDVVGREEELLGEEELRALRKWREREECIWGEVGRLDGLVAVLRDF